MVALNGCWVARVLGAAAGPCDGRLVRAHLLPKNRIGQELVFRKRREGERRWPLTLAERADLERILWDPRAWRLVCGGPTGISGHHGALDGLTLRIPRAKLPDELLEYAAEHDLVWLVDRIYGEEAA